MTQPIHPMLFAMADAMLDAIRKEHVYVNCVDGDPAHTIIDGGTFDFTLVARAAVQALMEPDEGMVEAWSDAEEPEDHPTEAHLNIRRYQAMLRPIVEGEGE